jgi:hypothetical protein
MRMKTVGHLRYHLDDLDPSVDYPGSSSPLDRIAAL